MHFFYDAQSRPAMVDFNGALYSYIHNLQGDIVGIVDNAGSLVVEYKYDAWGKPTLVRTLTTAYNMLAELNPFRYRGYILDGETNMYYLKNRYFNPSFVRFVNSDSGLGKIGGINSHNLFEYCLNVPNRFTDPDGRFPIIGFISCFIFASVYLAADVVAKRINDVYPDEDITDRARSKVLSIPFRIAEIRKDMNIPLDASLKVSIGVRNYSGFESVADSFSATNLISVTTSPFGWPGVIIGIALSLSYSALRPNQMPGSYAYISYEFTHDYQIAFHSSDPTETEPYLVETFTETWTVTDMFDGAYKNDFSLESYEDTGFPYKGASTSPIEIIY